MNGFEAAETGPESMDEAVAAASEMALAVIAPRAPILPGLQLDDQERVARYVERASPSS